MNFRNGNRAVIQLEAKIHAGLDGLTNWVGRTLEIGSDEIWIASPKVQTSLPRPNLNYRVVIELPVHPAAGHRCMHCKTELVSIEPLSTVELRLRFSVQAMQIRPCETRKLRAAAGGSQAVM